MQILLSSMESKDMSMINIQLSVLVCFSLDCDKNTLTKWYLEEEGFFGVLFSFGVVFIVFHLQVIEQELK